MKPDTKLISYQPTFNDYGAIAHFHKLYVNKYVFFFNQNLSGVKFDAIYGLQT